MTADSDNVTGDSENHHKIGQHQSERSVIFRRNDRSRSIGMHGQLGSEYANARLKDLLTRHGIPWEEPSIIEAEAR